MKRLGVVLVGGMMVLAQGTALPQDAMEPAAECITCARWRSYQQFDAQRFERGFLGSLNHEVDGVVESAIREVALIKMAQPDWNGARFTTVLHSLATGDRSLAIRVKASLAEAVFTEGLVFSVGGYRTDEEVFSAIVQQLERQRYAKTEPAEVPSMASRSQK